ncbi:hypothetical protein DKT77_01665 [Meridianimarinicoccus roseus]|uniref:Uncharacterized protein n=1 Tax=Meridianimarinicoccus roseus TaxID=2072018 RepID=A0A2V2LJY5_9RHOB|nr:hypothetical protein [Meridianimarinicoccus roseus]PWR04411.1 hypothetical protein DKT77_01665 [Meridianimarinicoccus roseus]
MSFVRPEVIAAARRWREALAGAAVMAAALWLWREGLGVVHWLALPVAGCGLALLVVGVQRGRFRGAGDGPGVVQVTEAQIGYFGPLVGGVVAIDAVQAITLDPTGRPTHWVLDSPDAPPLHIPVTAKGADALLDAFTQLPGFRLEPVLRLLGRPGVRPSRVWARPGSMAGAAVLRGPGAPARH